MKKLGIPDWDSKKLLFYVFWPQFRHIWVLGKLESMHHVVDEEGNSWAKVTYNECSARMHEIVVANEKFGLQILRFLRGFKKFLLLFRIIGTFQGRGREEGGRFLSGRLEFYHQICTSWWCNHSLGLKAAWQLSPILSRNTSIGLQRISESLFYTKAVNIKEFWLEICHTKNRSKITNQCGKKIDYFCFLFKGNA